MLANRAGFGSIGRFNELPSADMIGRVRRSRSPDRYEPLVEMAREMSSGTGTPAQTQFESLLELMRGPSPMRKGMWFVDRNWRLLSAVTATIALFAAHLVL